MPQVDLRKKPYYLKDDDINWVEKTISQMTDEEKIGQLFINLFRDLDADQGKEIIDKYHIGGVRYITNKSDKVHGFLSSVQRSSKIPLLVAANCDGGGVDAFKDGTYIANAAQCEASGDEKIAYNTGYVAGVETSAIGCNWVFNPVADILFTWRNTIVNNRAYGTDAETVSKYTSAYIDGVRESKMAVCAKHFPGDGVDERDHHLVLNVNDLSVEDWDNSFGKVYKYLIEEKDLETIMVGHIALPEYQYKLNPKLKYEDILPASLSPELLNGLLKAQLGFNGLVVTDASHMVGIAAAMKRKYAVPTTIAAGCDMFLFFNDHEEDFGFMMDGYKNGIISKKRLHDALRRILGLKAKLQLHKKQKTGTLVPPQEGLKVIGCQRHLDMAAEAADLGISLIKDTWSQLPMTPETHKRIQLHVLFGAPGSVLTAADNAEEMIVEELERVGFEVTLADPKKRGKGPTSDLTKNFDAVFIVSDIVGYATENNYRIKWGPSNSPWFVQEIPTIFVSLNFTTHLTDVPMIKTVINAYKDTREIIRQTIEKIIGKSEFKGQHFNGHVWCDMWESRR